VELGFHLVKLSVERGIHRLPGLIYPYGDLSGGDPPA
jgi:hypothetical protein